MHKICAVLLILAAAACAPLPQYTTLPLEQRPSPNFSARWPNFVILHHTGGDSTQQALATLTDPARKVSSHYLIARDGKIYYLVDELVRAWHAGASYWGGNRDLNSASIGIELDNNGEESYAGAQIEALLALLADLKTRYNIPAANFVGHGDVAPGRKVDPGSLFPWRTLAQRGFGRWCDPPYAPALPGADGITLLSAFGYDVADPGAAVAAFKRHFVPDDVLREMTERDLALLQCLLAQGHDQ